MKTRFAIALACLSAAAALPARADDDHHPDLTGNARAFHDVLSADWHAPAGEARNASACRNVGAYISLAGAIARQDGPEPWRQAGHALADASVALGAYCSRGNAGNVEVGLATLHDRFHDLMAVLRAPAEG